MVEFTLADLVGGEMLFPGRISEKQDRAERMAHLRGLFDDAMACMKVGNYGEARACLDGLLFAFIVANAVHAEKTAAEAEEERRGCP